MYKKIQGSQIKGKSHLNSMCEAMDFMTNKFEEYEWEWQEKDKIIDSMKSDMINMNERIEKLERILDRQEQYLHCNCLSLRSIAESECENTDDLVLEILNEKLHVDLTLSDLDRSTLSDLGRSHGIGQKKASSNKPRAAIVKFVSCNLRKRVFLNKKRLEGTQVNTTESLTAKRVGFLKEAREKHQFRIVWTSDGKILYKDGNG